MRSTVRIRAYNIEEKHGSNNSRKMKDCRHKCVRNLPGLSAMILIQQPRVHCLSGPTLRRYDSECWILRGLDDQSRVVSIFLHVAGNVPRAQSPKGVPSLLAYNLESPWERRLLLIEQKERSTTAVQTVCCCCARSVRSSLDGCTHRQDCSVCTRCSVSASAWSARCTSGTCA